MNDAIHTDKGRVCHTSQHDKMSEIGLRVMTEHNICGQPGDSTGQVANSLLPHHWLQLNDGFQTGT